MIPKIEISVKINKNVQWILLWCKSPVKPINELRAIMNRDVPMAFFIGSFANKTRAGIIKKPPPAPMIPVSKPTPIPIIIRYGMLMELVISKFFKSFFDRIIENEANSIMIAKKDIMKMSFVTSKPLMLKTVSGMAGTK